MRYMNDDERKLVKIINGSNSIPLNPVISRFSTVSRELTANEIKVCLIYGARVYDYHNRGEGARPLNFNNYFTVDEVIVDARKHRNKMKESTKNKIVEDTYTLSEEDIKNEYKQPEAPDVEDESLAM